MAVDHRINLTSVCGPCRSIFVASRTAQLARLGRMQSPKGVLQTPQPNQGPVGVGVSMN